MHPKLTEQIYNQLDQASNRLTEIILEQLQSERGVHLETAIAAPASLAGTLILRNTGVNFSNMEPGAPLLVENVNEKGMEVFAFMQGVCQPLGLEPLTGWQDPVPEGIGFLQPLLDLSRGLETPFMLAMRAFKLTDAWLPHVAAFACMKIIKMGSESLSPEIGKAIALFVLGSSSKMVPYTKP